MAKCMRGGIEYKRHRYKDNYGQIKCEACGNLHETFPNEEDNPKVIEHIKPENSTAKECQILFDYIKTEKEKWSASEREFLKAFDAAHRGKPRDS